MLTKLDLYFFGPIVIVSMASKEIIKNTVSVFRQEKQMTQEELGLVVGVSRQTIISIEKGNYTPSVHLALKIASFFKTPVEKIFKISYEQ